METTWTIAHQDHLSIEFSRQVYWSGLPFPSPGDLPGSGIEPASLVSPVLAGGFFTSEPPGKNLPANIGDTRDAGSEIMNIIQMWNKNILPVWQICPGLQSYSGLETSPDSRSVHLGACPQGSQEGEGWSQKGRRRCRWGCGLSWRLWRQSALIWALKQDTHPGPGPWSGTSCQSVSLLLGGKEAHVR